MTFYVNPFWACALFRNNKQHVVLGQKRKCLYVSFLHLANARGKTSWHKGLPVVKTIYTYSGFHELFLNFMNVSTEKDNNLEYEKITIVVDNIPLIP